MINVYLSGLNYPLSTLKQAVSHLFDIIRTDPDLLKENDYWHNALINIDGTPLDFDIHIYQEDKSDPKEIICYWRESEDNQGCDRYFLVYLEDSSLPAGQFTLSVTQGDLMHRHTQFLGTI